MELATAFEFACHRVGPGLAWWVPSSHLSLATGQHSGPSHALTFFAIIVHRRAAVTGNKGLNGAEDLAKEAKQVQENEVSDVVEVKIDNHSEPFATLVTINYGNKLGELLDTVRWT